MAQLTLGQIHERISEIDETIFQAETAQITLTDEEYGSLKIQVETLMQILAEGIASNSGKTFAQCYADRQKVRDADWIAMTYKRHMQMFPEPVPEHDAVIASAFGDKTKSGKQIAEELNKIYGYMFVNHQPKPVPSPPPAPTKRGVLRRLFEGRKS
jgi:hypothetical protein